MDRRIILAVAGSGKTTLLIDKLNLEKRFLIVTYTENNLMNIRQRIINKFSCFPHNITLLSYFQFLIRVCYRPFLKDKYKAKGILWTMPDATTFSLGCSNISFYCTSEGYLYHNRIALLCEECKNLIKQRIEKFYDYFIFDEVQDLGGHDFDLVLNIAPTNIECLFVGDFYQHTFDTSRDGNVNKDLYNNYQEYKRKWSDIGFIVDEVSLSKSYRCSPTICDFVSQELNIQIASHRQNLTNIIPIQNQNDADALFFDNTKVKLFYQEANKYACKAENWGKSKGLDSFQDVCVVLNESTYKEYCNGTLYKLSLSTLNKFYVACTRAKGDIFFIPHKFIDKYKRT